MRLGRALVAGDSRDEKYVQRIACGRHQLRADEPAARDGHGAGSAPFDYLLAGPGACTSITLRMYAERHGWELGTVTVAFARANGGNRIDREVAIAAPLTEGQRARLAEICERAPVTLAILQAVAIETRLQLA